MTNYRAKQEVRCLSANSNEWVYFIVNELVTQKEFERRTEITMNQTSNYFKSKFEKIRICPKNTYFFFGIRVAVYEKIIEITPV